MMVTGSERPTPFRPRPARRRRRAPRPAVRPYGAAVPLLGAALPGPVGAVRVRHERGEREAAHRAVGPGVVAGRVVGGTGTGHADRLVQAHGDAGVTAPGGAQEQRVDVVGLLAEGVPHLGDLRQPGVVGPVGLVGAERTPGRVRQVVDGGRAALGAGRAPGGPELVVAVPGTPVDSGVELPHGAAGRECSAELPGVVPCAGVAEGGAPQGRGTVGVQAQPVGLAGVEDDGGVLGDPHLRVGEIADRIGRVARVGCPDEAADDVVAGADTVGLVGRAVVGAALARVGVEADDVQGGDAGRGFAVAVDMPACRVTVRPKDRASRTAAGHRPSVMSPPDGRRAGAVERMTAARALTRGVRRGAPASRPRVPNVRGSALSAREVPCPVTT